MQTPVQTVQRLIVALETLLATQGTLIEQNDLDPLPAIHDRASLVGREIAHLLAQPEIRAQVPPSFLERGRTMVKHQETLLEFLAERRAEMQRELQSINSVQIRLSKYRSAYGWPRAMVHPKSFALA